MSLATAPNLAFVPVDFESDSLFESLCHSGYRPGAPGFFSWLAVTQYLTREAIFDTLRMVASMASGTDQNEERMRLFDRVAAFLVNASKANPIMLHLEDLHWADKPSLSLLQHLARRFEGGRLLVVGTYRDVELDRSHPLSTMVGELRHERLYQRVLLRGLSESEVKELIEAISQQVAERRDAAFVRAVLRETEGNPFFIEEVLRHLVESGGLHRREGRWVAHPKAIAEAGFPRTFAT